MDIIFLSTNENKRKEIEKILEIKKLSIMLIKPDVYKENLKEYQTDDILALIKYKLQKAFELYKRPIMVEHTILKIESLNNYPGTQTSLFWEKITEKDIIKGESICKIVGAVDTTEKRNAAAVTYIGYTDGKNLIIENGECKGEIAKSPKGNSKFQWDTIFIPYEKNEKQLTFSEMGDLKNEISMRKRALDKFAEKFISKNCKNFYNEFNIGIDDKVIGDIVKLIKKDKLVLFVGAGVSKNIDMPTWGELIGKLGYNLEYDKDMFKKLGDSLELAEFYQLRNDTKKELLKEVFCINKDEEGLNKKISACNIYKYLTNLNIKTIYTTNYEDLLERAFNVHQGEECNVIYDLNTLNDSKEGNVEIIKLHGDFKKEEDIVLTQTSYFNRYNFENPLDIKLRNDLLTKSILFIGYSFSDNNIKYMMHKLNSLWQDTNNAKRAKSYMFLTDNNPVQRTIIEKMGNVKTIVSEEIDKKQGLENFLCKIVNKLE